MGDDSRLEKSAQHLLLCPFPSLWGRTALFSSVYTPPLLLSPPVSRSAQASGRGSEAAFPRFCAQTLLVLGVSLDLKVKEGGQWRKLEMIPLKMQTRSFC